MSHKKVQGKIIKIAGVNYKVGKFDEIKQRGKKIGGFKIYKRGAFAYETYKAKLRRVR